MRIKKIKFGNDPTIHFIVGLDLNRIEISLYSKNLKTKINDLRIKKDFYIVDDKTILDDVDNSFIRESDVVIVDLVYDMYNEYLALQKVEDGIWSAQLENTGYVEFNEDYKEGEDNYS